MVLLSLLWLALGADELTPAKAAKIQKDMDAAMAEVSKKYGNKQSSELTQDERREMIRDQRAAEVSVLEKHNVDAKEFARYEAKMTMAERAATKEARAVLDKKEAEAKKAADVAQQPREIPIQRGFSDQNPVTLEESSGGSGAPVVEKGLPPEAQADQAEAASMGTGDEPSTTKKGGKKK